MVTTIQVTFDAAEPHTLAEFWAQALDYQVEDHSAIVDQLLDAGKLNAAETVVVSGRRAFTDLAACSDRSGVRPRLLFQRVPEPKVTKNRVHLDLQVGAEHRPTEVDRLIGLGATIGWESSDRGPVTTTLRDPEGNELCV